MVVSSKERIKILRRPQWSERSPKMAEPKTGRWGRQRVMRRTRPCAWHEYVRKKLHFLAASEQESDKELPNR